MNYATPMLQQYQKIKNDYQDAILFFRLGDFYEMFLEDAETAAKILEITLTARDAGNNQKIPMCGIPYHAVETYLPKLLAAGHKVAICEQTEDPRPGKGIVKREVIRVVTPGTLVENNMLDEKSHNYLASVVDGGHQAAVAYLDISTGSFQVTFIDKDINGQKLLNEIFRINPAEILVSRSFACQRHEFLERVRQTLPVSFEVLENDVFSLAENEDVFRAYFAESSLPKEIRENEFVLGAVVSLLVFLQDTQKKTLHYLQDIEFYQVIDYMSLDFNTYRHLEITKNNKSNEVKGSLLDILDKTVTAMGGRCLKSWLERPLKQKLEIESRLAGVADLVAEPLAREDLKSLLRPVYDLERLLTRVSYGTASARDMLALKTSLTNLPEIRQLLAKFDNRLINDIREDFDDLQDVGQLLSASMAEDPPLTLREGNIIKKGYHDQVDHYRRLTSRGRGLITELENQERNKTGIKSLKVGYNKVFGYYLEVTKSHLDSVPDYFIRKQTLANAERYITEDLKAWENQVVSAKEKLNALEYEVFQQVRAQIEEAAVRIRKMAHYMAVLDVLVSLAQVAVENHYVCPQITEANQLHIKEGRHPVIETMEFSEPFVPNDVYLDPEQQLLLITGPNMAGKSTFMRQTALIVFLAHIGSFVPAEKAVVPLTDRIFTRIGAADDLSSGQSTFMVEMKETAEILKNATPRSLVILDEIGRGTSTYDGLSIAWAVAEALLRQDNQAKTLFATHYHELTQLADLYDPIKNFTMAVKEKNGKIIFLRKVIAGAANKSYGIHVAELAGIPENIIARARKVLHKLENESLAMEISPQEVRGEISSQQMHVFDLPPAKDELLLEIEQLDLNKLTPLDALLKLHKWQEKLKTEE